MKLLYIGTHFCPADSLARLLLLGDELCFLDRPSVTFGNWGTIGTDSFMRRVSFEGSPVKVSVLRPPGGPAGELYEPYVLADISNPDFIRALLWGLKSDDQFAERLLPANANYGSGKNGSDIRGMLLADETLPNAIVTLESGEPDLMYKPELPEGRKSILRTLAVDVSIQVTSALLIADEIEALPIADDLTLPKLMALRASSSKYIGGTPSQAPFLGLQFARSVIPDEVLRKLDFKDIFSYRAKTQGLYQAWNTELARASAKIADCDNGDPNIIQSIIVSDLMPKVKEYENEMASARDQLFGSLIKSATAWELPTISLSYVANLGYTGAIAMFVAGLRASVPHLVDYVNARRSAKRNHAVSYWLGLTKR